MQRCWAMQHVIPPFAGEGATIALLYAPELNECLTSDSYATLQDAISTYETDMRKRASAAAEESLSEFYQFRQLPKPEHPLTSPIDVEAVKHLHIDEPVGFMLNFYSIAIKRMSNIKVKYGLNTLCS